MKDRDFFTKNSNTWSRIVEVWPDVEEIKPFLKNSLDQFGVYLLRTKSVLKDSDQSKQILKDYLAGLGDLLNQSPTGSDLFEVKNEEYGLNHPKFRGPSSNHKLTFHTDRCDVIVFYCVRPADLGGINQFVRAKTVYDVLQSESPELLEVLKDTFAYKRHNADPAFPNNQYDLSVFDNEDGEVYITLMTYLINKADQDPDLPSLSILQRSALDKVQEICQRPENQLELKLDAGDMLFLNNTQMLHSRSAFEDRQEMRLYYRVWMTFPWSQALPESFKPIFGSVKAGVRRGGFRLL